MFELNGEAFLSSRECAERLGISPASLRTYRSDGREPIPSIKLSGAVLYRVCDVEAYLDKRAIT